MQTVLCLHGFTGHGSDWSATISCLPQTYQALAPDIVGHGDDTAPDDLKAYCMETVAEYLMRGLSEPLTLVGYSMGGRLALYIACHYPDQVRGLVLVSASPGLRTETERAERRQRDEQLADQIEAQGMAWFVEYWSELALWDSQSEALKAQLNAQRARHTARGLAQNLRGMGTGAMPSLWDDLPHLTMPVQLIVGALDHKFVALNQDMMQAIPHAELFIVPDAGHALHLEQPDRFQQILTRFLADHP
ncbi:MAG: 2-succinyl-6-hydroxy-2,4-cyclohexadiene-1-carboxylate synthase [Anaerolineae bacterium]